MRKQLAGGPETSKGRVFRDLWSEQPEDAHEALLIVRKSPMTGSIVYVTFSGNYNETTSRLYTRCRFIKHQ